MSEHTPIPWACFYEGSGDYLILSADSEEIASCSRVDAHFMHTGKGSDINEANSQFIVTAVNSHESLTQQNAELKKALERLLRDVQDYEAWQRPCDAVDQARAVLEKWK